MNNELYNYDWYELTRDDFDINSIYDKICKEYQKIFDNNIPKIICNVKSKNIYNQKIRKMIKKKRNLVKYRQNSKIFREKHRELIERIGSEIEIYETIKMNQLIEKSDNLYSLYKSIKGMTKFSQILSFNDENGLTINDSHEIVENFRQIFESKFITDFNSIHPNFTFENNEGLSDLFISMNDILNALKTFKINKSEGKSFIKNIIIKNCLNGITKILYVLYNRIIDLKKIPNEMKLSIVSPVLKHNKKKNSFSSYRCISVQPNIYRIFETILLNKMIPFIEINQIIPQCQYGYKKSVSISDIHIDIQKLIFNSLINKNIKAIDIIFLDLSDAFDSISQKRLLNKLKIYGFSGLMFDIISETFNNRRQIVKYNGVFSSETLVKSGTLQGGVLSPTLFNIYLADIVYKLQSKIFKFADDLCLIRPILSEIDCQILQSDLNEIYTFCEENSLKLNPSKCEFLRISHKNTEIFDYKLNDNIIKSVDFHKHIGVFYDRKMSFNIHIDNIAEKSLKKFYLLKHICKRVNGLTFLKLYVTYVLPILEIYNLSLVLNKTQTNRLESVQRSITKYICYKMNKIGLSYEEIFKF